MDSSQKKCPFCAELISSEAIKCKHCGELVDCDTNEHSKRIQELKSQSKNTAKSRKGIAAVLSLVFPGAGQVYNGELAKGVFVVALVGLSYWFSREIPIILFLAIPFHLASIQDAYTKAVPSK